MRTRWRCVRYCVCVSPLLREHFADEELIQFLQEIGGFFAVPFLATAEFEQRGLLRIAIFIAILYSLARELRASRAMRHCDPIPRFATAPHRCRHFNRPFPYPHASPHEQASARPSLTARKKSHIATYRSHGKHQIALFAACSYAANSFAHLNHDIENGAQEP